MGRGPDTSGQAFWVGQIAPRTRGGVAHAFFQTPESAAFRITDLYDYFLGRTPSTADKAFWTPILLRRGDIALAVFLASSNEYANRAEDRFPIAT